MPVEVTKYTCQFRCGKKAVGNRGTMLQHESACWKNRLNKTCKTCSNEIYEVDFGSEMGLPKGYARSCKISAIATVLENEDVKKIMVNQNTFHVRPVFHCHYWNKDDDGQAMNFAAKLEKSITALDSDTAGEDFKYFPFYNKPQKEVTGDNFPW